MIIYDLTADMVNEAREKLVLHWNYRGLTEIPEAVRTVCANVQEIYLKWNELTSLPIWLGEFERATNLYLYGNKIDRLPDSLGLMTRLVVLDLSANRLEELPDCLGSLESLRSLMLAQNRVASLPASMSKLRNLESLCLSGNQLVALPEWLGSLPRLEELFVDNNRLRELPNRLTLSPALTTISVCSNELGYLPLNAFLSSPQIRFDSNPRLNYLSLPVLHQLVSKLRQPLSDREAQANAIAYGCFDSSADKRTSNRNRDVGIKLSLVQADSNRKRIEVELPRQLLAVHGLRENNAISLWETSLRKVYSSRFRHTLEVRLDSQVIARRKSVDQSTTYDWSNEFPKSCLALSLISNGPVSICTLDGCNEPIFTEAWFIFGIGRNALLIPTIVIFCSNRCAAEFVKSSNFTENHEMYVMKKN